MSTQTYKVLECISCFNFNKNFNLSMREVGIRVCIRANLIYKVLYLFGNFTCAVTSLNDYLIFNLSVKKNKKHAIKRRFLPKLNIFTPITWFIIKFLNVLWTFGSSCITFCFNILFTKLPYHCKIVKRFIQFRCFRI